MGRVFASSMEARRVAPQDLRKSTRALCQSMQTGSGFPQHWWAPSLRYRGTSLIKNAFPQDPTVGLCIGPYDSPGGGSFSHERGTPCINPAFGGVLRCMLPQGLRRGHPALSSWCRLQSNSPGNVLNLRTITSQKREVAPGRACI